jgi:hypothetical protein
MSYLVLRQKYQDGTISENDNIEPICWNYVNFECSHWREIIDLTQRKSNSTPPSWLLGHAIRSGNIDGVEFCLDNGSELNAHQYLRNLSEIGYPVVKYLFNRNLLKLNSYLFDDRLCYYIFDEDSAIKIACLFLDNGCEYTEWCLSFALREKKYKLYKYLRSRGIEWNPDTALKLDYDQRMKTYFGYDTYQEHRDDHTCDYNECEYDEESWIRTKAFLDKEAIEYGFWPGYDSPYIHYHESFWK